MTSTHQALSLMAHSKNFEPDSCWHFACLQLLHGYRCSIYRCEWKKLLFACSSHSALREHNRLFPQYSSFPGRSNWNSITSRLERCVLLLDNIFLFIQISVTPHLRFHLKMEPTLHEKKKTFFEFIYSLST